MHVFPLTGSMCWDLWAIAYSKEGKLMLAKLLMPRAQHVISAISQFYINLLWVHGTKFASFWQCALNSHLVSDRSTSKGSVTTFPFLIFRCFPTLLFTSSWCFFEIRGLLVMLIDHSNRYKEVISWHIMFMKKLIMIIHLEDHPSASAIKQDTQIPR